ncbi:MAG: hypothetical protein R2757_08230 [Draconibacterium sp.]
MSNYLFENAPYPKAITRKGGISIPMLYSQPITDIYYFISFCNYNLHFTMIKKLNRQWIDPKVTYPANCSAKFTKELNYERVR